MNERISGVYRVKHNGIVSFDFAYWDAIMECWYVFGNKDSFQDSDFESIGELVSSDPVKIKPISYHISYQFQSGGKQGFGDFVSNDVYIGVQSGDIKELKRRACIYAMKDLDGAIIENTTAVILSINKLTPWQTADSKPYSSCLFSYSAI